MATKETDLDKRFKEAIERASNTKLKFPPDLMLYFYAYYKRATGDHTQHEVEKVDRSALIGAFKMNALFQIKNLSPRDAKRKYIDLVKKHIPKDD